MTHPFQTDVLIVGGGPAGASTALSLLKYSGLTVTIVEQSALDGVRVGEQVNNSLFDLLLYLGIDKADFEPDSFLKGYSNLAAWGSDRLQSRDSIFSNDAGSFQLDRAAFDLKLLAQAAEKGATILPRTKCLHFEQNDNNNEWTVDLVHETKGQWRVQSKFLVDATGRQSNVARKLGIPSVKQDELVAVGAFLTFDAHQPLKQEIVLETIPQGWWYCATLPNQTMTVTLFTDANSVKENQWHQAKNWQQLLANTVHIKHKLIHAKASSKPWVKNAFSQITTSTGKPHFIAVGDAAASFDPISSMGLGFAISSACHAARALMDCDKGNSSAIGHYQGNIETIFNNYLSLKRQFYSKEQRWADAAFWGTRK
jgi:flavin-dependent dehydrogenase